MILFEVIIYRIFNDDFYSKIFSFNSNFKIEDLIDMVEDNFDSELTDSSLSFPIKTMLSQEFNLKKKLKNLENILRDFIALKYNDTDSIEEILFIDFFDNKINCNEFKNNIPFLNYSFLKEICLKTQKQILYNKKYSREKNTIGKSTNKDLIPHTSINFTDITTEDEQNQIFYLSDVYDYIKIYAFYLTKFYINYFSNSQNVDESCLLLKMFFQKEVKESGFIVRKNIKEEMLLEKLVDTETLYTVFERC